MFSFVMSSKVGFIVVSAMYGETKQLFTMDSSGATFKMYRKHLRQAFSARRLHLVHIHYKYTLGALDQCRCTIQLLIEALSVDAAL